MRVIHVNGRFYRKSFGNETPQQLGERLALMFAMAGQFPLITIREQARLMAQVRSQRK